MRVSPLTKSLVVKRFDNYKHAVDRLSNNKALAVVGVVGGFCVIQSIWNKFVDWLTPSSNRVITVVRMNSDSEDKKHHH